MNKSILVFFLATFLVSEELITPIPLTLKFDIEKAKLGKKLFNDTRLSKNNTISCATCHILEEGGDDNLKVSFGINGQTGTRNSPTVLNARFNSNQFWDGRAKDLQEQVKGPIHNPVEMGSNFKEVVNKLKKDSHYISEFKTIYPDGITSTNISNAIAEFENSLITPNSQFDKFLRGDIKALTSYELEGYILFKEYGCISCHNGINIGGNLMQKIGVLEDFNTSDFGKYNVTKNIEDKFYFKVPSLRNIQLTSPYFHDGLTGTLKEAVNKMTFYQVGYTLKEDETNKIIFFLKTLTGELVLNNDGNNE
jgi:cytochrome c peroxidase